MDVAYYQLILQHRSVFNTPQMPLPSCADIGGALDLLDCMVDALYAQLKDVRAKQFSYEGHGAQLLPLSSIDLTYWQRCWTTAR